MAKSTWEPSRPDYPQAVEDANGEKVIFACVTLTSPDSAVALANTRLAAAAPDLLEACKKTLEYLTTPGGVPDLVRLRNAIAKAERCAEGEEFGK